jgi:hypothetical protein
LVLRKVKKPKKDILLSNLALLLWGKSGDLAILRTDMCKINRLLTASPDKELTLRLNKNSQRHIKPAHQRKTRLPKGSM